MIHADHTKKKKPRQLARENQTQDAREGQALANAAPPVDGLRGEAPEDGNHIEATEPDAKKAYLDAQEPKMENDARKACPVEKENQKQGKDMDSDGVQDD